MKKRARRYEQVSAGAMLGDGAFHISGNKLDDLAGLGTETTSDGIHLLGGHQVIRSVLILCFLLLAGCSTMSNLMPPVKEQYVVVAEAHVRERVLGLAQVLWLEGLQPGTYTAVGEDQNGIYFMGEGPCIIILSNREEIEAYRQTKHVSSAIAGDTRRVPRALNEGGLWLPKPGTSEAPKLFYLLRNPEGGTANFGLVGEAFSVALEGSIEFIPFDTERPFFQSLTVIDR